MRPTSDDDATIGARLRALRLWRHMTLAEVAGLSGVSAAYLSMVERGLRSLDRRSMISALASALKVSDAELTGGPPHMGTDSQQSGPHAAIPALRTALLTNSLWCPATADARPVAELGAEMRAIEALYRRCDFVTIGQRLPTLIDELHVQARPGAAEDVREAALGDLIEACITASLMAKNLGYRDLAHVAALRAEEAARGLGDPGALGKGAFLRFHTVPREMTSWDRALVTAERAADALQPHADDLEAVSVLGLLTLSAALAAAVLQRGPAVEHWLSESAALAARVPDEMASNWQCFCPANVGIWRTTLAVERGEGGGKVAELAAAVDERKISSQSRRAAFLVDVGRGVARDPKARADAIRWMRRAEDAAPQYVRNSTPARETVAFLLNRCTSTAGGRELRGLAARMDVPH